MCALGSPPMPGERSLRRAHSPAAISASASSAPSDDAHARAEQARLDRIAHQEDAAERQRQAADPHHPAGAEAFLEAHRRRGGRRGGRRRAPHRCRGRRRRRGRVVWRRGRRRRDRYRRRGRGGRARLGSRRLAAAARRCRREGLRALAPSAPRRCSSERTCPRAPIAITSATIATIGNASRTRPISTTSDMSCPGQQPPQGGPAARR